MALSAVKLLFDPFTCTITTVLFMHCKMIIIIIIIIIIIKLCHGALQNNQLGSYLVH